MKIIMINHAWHGGGAEYVGRVWCRELAARGHTVTYVTTDRQDRSSTVDLPNVRYVRLGATPGLLGRVLRMARAIRGDQPDILLTLQTYPNIVTLLAAALTGQAQRVVISERNMPSVILRREGRSQRLQLQLAKLLYRHALGAVAISHPVAADLVSSFGLPPERCLVVPNPALDKITGQSGGLRQDRASSASNRHITIALPFRLSAQKNPGLSVETAAVLQHRGWSVSLVSFGSGPLEKQLVEAARRERIGLDLRGWTEDWYLELPQSSVVLLPSSYEGFGNVLVEAAAMGVSSVASSTALGVADAIAPGITGALALSLAPQDLADALEKAAAITPDQSSPWLERFSTNSSVDLLEGALQHLKGVRRARD